MKRKTHIFHFYIYLSSLSRHVHFVLYLVLIRIYYPYLTIVSREYDIYTNIYIYTLTYLITL